MKRRDLLKALTTIAGSGLLPSSGRSIFAEVPTTQSEPEPTSSTFVRREFQASPKKYRPIVRWWWPGNDVEEAELRREIGVLDEAGFGGAEIQAFFKGLDSRSLNEEEMQKIDSYASPSFFRHVGAAADEAGKRGMFIDYTFGSGWPFGGGDAITPELASVELRATHLSIEGPAKLHTQMQIPAIGDGDPLHRSSILDGLPAGWADRLKKRAKVVAVVAARGEDAEWDFHAADGPTQTLLKPGQLQRGTSIDLTSRLQSDGILDWDVPSGTWQLFVFCSVPTGQRVNGGAGTGPQLVLDHLNAAAFAAHAKRVGDNAIPYLGQYFGSGLRAIFCDSLEVEANLYWSDDFLTEFERRRGYDLLPYLPILKVQSHAEPFGAFVDLPVFDIAGIGDQVRCDYRRTLSDLVIERFYGQFNQWAHEHNLLTRTQAHGAPADVLRIYGDADIPETEDLYDNGCYDFLKMAASAAHVGGRATVGSESFVWPNGAYQTTPEKMKIAADELLTAGVNAIVYHGFPYILPQIPPPGWHPFSGINGSGNYSSQCNEMNPFWPFFAQLNGYITRIQYISQLGKNVAAVALYRNDLAHGAEDLPPTPKLNQALMDAGYNYDHINAESLLECKLSGNMLVTQSGTRYKALVLPPTDAIGAALAEKLAEFAHSGLPTVFAGQVPAQADGQLEYAQNTERVQAAMHGMRGLRNVHAANGLDDAISALEGAVSPNIRFRGPALPFMHKRIRSINIFFLRNPSDSLAGLRAEFEADGEPELWDAWTGSTATIAFYRRTNNWVEIQYDLQPFSSALIVFDPEARPRIPGAPPRTPTLLRSEEIGSAGWKLAATGLAPSGKAAVVRRSLPSLIDWSLDDELRGISGRGVYTTTFAVSAAHRSGSLVLDLGRVKDAAQVAVNGKPAGNLLLRPYQIDITNLVQPGENELEIAVTNALYNCMVLRDPPAFRPGPAENPSGLMSSGLIGPVQMKVLDG